MDNLQDVLSDLLDSVLDFLSANLPPPLYSVLSTILSHTFAAATALANLCASLLSNNPANWNAQTLLPPVITILVAYLALMSVYRTTAWFARTMFWFLKWGSMFGIMMAGAGYFMGNAGNGAGNALGNHGAISMLGGLLGQFFDDNTAPRTRKTRPSKKSQPKMKPRPKAWESFNRHNEWQNQQRNPGHDDNDQFQQLMNMVSGAGQILSGNWWNVIKSAAATGEKSTEKKGPEAAQKPAKKTRSR